MSAGTHRRVVSLWFPRLATDRVLRARPVDGPFALTLKEDNANRLHCLNDVAEKQGLYRGMSFTDARAFCPDLVSLPARPDLEARFLAGLRRWAAQWSPWIGSEGR
ncbi:MAG: DNA polymerase Y family protein, partial [Paracoccus sp. (in: a-proteobacteria)]|nr:DNA polymerase Y family protein [Paracoccus sp. (in: a-proteobacteria)]